MLKRYTKNIDFDLYRNAADKLGVAYVPAFAQDEPCGYFLAGGRRVFIERNKLGVNNSISNSFARNKYRTYQLLGKFSLPIPGFVLLTGEESVERAAASARGLHKPLVVKPVRGSLARGVSVRIEKPRVLALAGRIARRFAANVLFAEFVEGTNYRVTVFAGDVVDVIERVPAYVTGDGKSSLQVLIEAKNALRSSLYLKPIRVDRELKRHIAAQKLTLASVSADGERITLRLGCNMSAGGETRRLDIARDVHPDNVEMFIAARKALGLALAGIDFITPDIAKSYKDVRCVINEINRAPMLDAHYFADFAMDNVVGERILTRALALAN
ncbi:MAG: ATP-grasp domain-containing protein [Gammaproteobacteria bacterium]|nr:ATP-grasp domain-containing protein [Gammaproteobacteria bacterium]